MDNSGRPSMGIGEVLSALKLEFPDITVSKIRFLESEGLLQPQRTASKYRRFSTSDLDRLRFILKLQRESFLPLKVIKERLAAADAGHVSPEQISSPSAAPVVVHMPAPVQQLAPAPPPVPASELAEDLRAEVATISLTESDLANETGLDLTQVKALASFGVLCGHGNNGTVVYDATDLEIAKIAREFLKLGLEPRHLKTLRRLAEQEADLYTQVVAPTIKARRPEAREEATETLTELATLSRNLRRTYVLQSLRATLRG